MNNLETLFFQVNIIVNFSYLYPRNMKLLTSDCTICMKIFENHSNDYTNRFMLTVEVHYSLGMCDKIRLYSIPALFRCCTY